jgi:hypothetical protein
MQMSTGVRWTQQEYEAYLKRSQTKIAEEVKATTPPKEIKPAMSKTEMEYERTYLSRVAHKFEGITLKMANGHRYTPDFYVCPEGNVIELHEVKGGYKLQSYGRAKLAFDQAKIEYPEFKFVWATKTKDGWRFQ